MNNTERIVKVFERSFEVIEHFSRQEIPTHDIETNDLKMLQPLVDILEFAVKKYDNAVLSKDIYAMSVNVMVISYTMDKAEKIAQFVIEGIRQKEQIN